MKYTPEITKKLIKDWEEDGKTVEEIAVALTAETGQTVPKRSVVAKLSSLGIYERKQYVDKTGKVPVKKCEYINSISKSLKMTPDELESLEKVTKRILAILDQRLQPDPKPDQVHEIDMIEEYRAA